MELHGVEPLSETALEPWLLGRSLAEWREEFDSLGYVVFDRVLNDAQLDQIRAAVAPWQTKTGRNDFEGVNSTRVYALLAKAPQVFGELVVHPLALGFAEAELGPSCLLSALIAIELHPGETVQPWHIDDAQCGLPMPRPALGLSAFWAIDETTEENGATEVVPGSHLAGPDDVLEAPVTIALKPGSLMLVKGNLRHRGGANNSQANRLIVTPQYCGGWLRPIENMMAAVPKPVAQTLPKRVRQLIGYNIHGTFMGYVDGVHPDNTLDLPVEELPQ